MLESWFWFNHPFAGLVLYAFLCCWAIFAFDLLSLFNDDDNDPPAYGG